MAGGADRYAGPSSLSASTRADPHTVRMVCGLQYTHTRTLSSLAYETEQA